MQSSQASGTIADVQVDGTLELDPDTGLLTGDFTNQGTGSYCIGYGFTCYEPPFSRSSYNSQFGFTADLLPG
ncbi:MAG: hypothetical protein ACAI44_29410 [Candidatus Sericytochromatia bacterium]